MYSNEIGTYLAQHNYCLNNEEYMELTPQKNPQISRLVYDTSTNKFHMYTYDGYDWEFEVHKN